MSLTAMLGVSFGMMQPQLLASKHLKQHKHSSSSSTHHCDYDYIVVGSGPGGATCANRLAEDKHNRVLILEAGPSMDDSISIAAGLCPGQTDSPAFCTVPIQQEFNFFSKSDPDINGRSWNSQWARVTGGCSAHNGSVFTLADASYFDNWQAFTGGPWSANDIRSQLDSWRTIRNPEGQVLTGRGPLQILQPTHDNDIVDIFGQTILDLYGIPVTPANDFQLFTNSPQIQYSQDSSETVFMTFLPPPANVESPRSWASEAFLTPRKNLTFLYDAPALRVVFKGKKAVGVEYFSEGESRIAYANKGVVLAAGFHNTAKILNVSGVGTAERLASLGVEPISLVPAGENFKMQPGLTLFMLMDPQLVINSCNNKINAFGISGLQSIASLPDATRPADADKRGWQLQFNPFPIDANTAGALLDIYFFLPLSTGQSGALNNDPTWSALFEPNGLSDPADVVSLTQIALEMRQFTDYIEANFPGAIVAIFDGTFTSPEFLTDPSVREQWVRNNVGNAIHESGTCRMGPNDGTNVVNHKGRVYGTKNLYVADNSIIPNVPDNSISPTYPGNTQAIAYIIGNQIGKQLTGKIKKKHH
ncbi:MAG: GMC family oxidoreductase [Verrucomicrobia bacterium]|nr:GMC family oxidoreductase [Verrucomicrobiota bacterium]MBS0637862.1 GMC family oxidoreductase [Verrucomicrobiota bacterium]